MYLCVVEYLDLPKWISDHAFLPNDISIILPGIEKRKEEYLKSTGRLKVQFLGRICIGQCQLDSFP